MFEIATAFLLTLAKVETGWKVSDTTDNDTGIRTVDAMNMYMDDNEYLTLRMECVKGKPAFIIDWHKLQAGDLTVFTIGAVPNSYSEPLDNEYIFEKTDDPLPGNLVLKGDPRTLIAALGNAPYAVITAHLTYGTKTVGLSTKETQIAWKRVAERCPAKVETR